MCRRIRRTRADLFACCSFRHGLRRATFLREEGFCLAQTNLSLPLGEMSRSDREGWNQLTWFFKFVLIRICPRAALSVICFANASSPKGRAEKPVRTFSSYAQSKLVSPFGRDVAQRQRGLEPADMAFQVCPDTNLPACCPLSHLLRKCQLSQGESREAGGNFFLLRTIQTCLSLWERCRAATERAGSLFEGAGLPPCGKTEGVLPLHRWRGPPPLSGEAELGSPERGAVTK